jgi:hypothetical protein
MVLPEVWRGYKATEARRRERGEGRREKGEGRREKGDRFWKYGEGRPLRRFLHLRNNQFL